MILVGVANRGSLVEADAAYTHSETELVGLTEEACNNFPLISAYHQRPRINELFDEAAEHVRQARLRQRQVARKLNAWAKWIHPSFTGVYMIFGAPHVFAGVLPLGVFLTTIKAVSEISQDFISLYGYLTQFSIAADAMVEMTTYLNLATNLKAQKALNRFRRRLVDEFAAEQGKEVQLAGANIFDSLPIKVNDVGFAYFGCLDRPVLKDIGFTIPQGKLVAVVGPHSSGKATLLRLLAHIAFPTEGEIFIPTHLRLLHVPRQPYLLGMSAFENLTFGTNNPTHKSPERVLKILKMLSMENEDFLQDLRENITEQSSSDASVSSDEDGEAMCSLGKSFAAEEKESESALQNWISTLSDSEEVSINLARAFIYNPEVLVLHRCLSHFTAHTSKEILKIIKRHVDERGILLPPESRHRRRPRTCFFVPEDVDGASYADIILQVCPGKNPGDPSSLYSVRADQLTKDFVPSPL